MKWTLVAVKWEDITSLVRFNLSQSFDQKRLYKLSVGFVVRETKEYVVIADDVDLSSDGDSYNNYGTLIPRGCIRDWKVIRTLEVPTPKRFNGKLNRTPAAVSPPRNGRKLTAFLQANPSLIASAEEIALRLGMGSLETELELGQLEADHLVARMRGPQGDEFYLGPGIKAAVSRSPRRAKRGNGRKQSSR